MTNKRILELAYNAALENWYREYEKCEKTTNCLDSEIAKERAIKAEQELNEVRELLLTEENKADA